MSLVDYCNKKGLKIRLPEAEDSYTEEVSEAPIPPVFLNDHWPVEEVEEFFLNVSLPVAPFKLNPWTTIIDFEKFINSHLEVAKAKNGQRLFNPTWERLLKLKEVLERTHFK